MTTSKVKKIKYIMYNVPDYSVLYNNSVRTVIREGCYFTHIWKNGIPNETNSQIFILNLILMVHSSKFFIKLIPALFKQILHTGSDCWTTLLSLSVN